MRWIAAYVVTMMLATPTVAVGQGLVASAGDRSRPEEAWWRGAEPPGVTSFRQEVEPSVARPILVGTGLGVAGGVVGGLVGVALARDCGDSSCGLGWAYVGAAVGETVGLSLGVHLGNGRRGSLVVDFLVAAAFWGAGYAFAEAYELDNTPLVIALVTIPPAQLLATVLVERSIGRARGRSRIGLLVAPRSEGGAALGATLRM